MAEQQNQNKNANAKEQDIHQLLKVRREKLSELQTEGRDPFQITKYDQTAHSADIKDHYAEYDGKEVSIAVDVETQSGVIQYKVLDIKRVD